jgi:hypothetical protein
MYEDERNHSSPSTGIKGSWNIQEEEIVSPLKLISQ